MTLADEGAAMIARGITSAADPLSQMPQLGLGAMKKRGIIYSKLPIVTAPCKNWKKRHPETGPLTLHDTHPSGAAHGCFPCRRLRNLAYNLKNGRAKRLKDANPDHPYHHTKARINARARGILFNGHPVTHEEELLVMIEENGRCALCGRLFSMLEGVRRSKNRDHRHENSDGSGPFRGFLCGGRNGCNFVVMSRYENGGRNKLTSEQIKACRRYDEDSPGERVALRIAMMEADRA